MWNWAKQLEKKGRKGRNGFGLLSFSWYEESWKRKKKRAQREREEMAGQSGRK